METVEYFMREALRVAEVGLRKGELPIGAVVVLDGQIIAAAHTQERGQKRLLVHAELLALEEADEWSGLSGNRRQIKLFTNLEPCLMCFGAAMSFMLGEIYYGLESPGDGATNLIQAWKRDEPAFPAYRIPQVRAGLLREESQALFQRYADHFTTGNIAEWARTLAKLER